MSRLAIDTSVALRLLVATHDDNEATSAWAVGRDLALSGHAVAETYSVITRLAGDARVAPADAAGLLAARFAPPLLLSSENGARVPATLAAAGIAGGAVYDALVGLAALEHGASLATADARAAPTYAAIGVETIWVPT